MKKILITGAAGNVGTEVIHFLFQLNYDLKIVAGVRNVSKARKYFNNFPGLEFAPFDFENPDTFTDAFHNVESLFLLRPPHISDIDKVFKPLLEQIKKSEIKEIIFLSVQGAEKSTVIPHNKIEKLIKGTDINYIFLRPGYFMQNLTTTLLNDIKRKEQIILPAGKAKFNWIDIKNIGEAAAMLLQRFKEFKNQAIELTGYENKNFYHVARIMSKSLPHQITYRSVNPIKFFFIKRKEDIPTGMIIVMIFLHYLPRFQKEPRFSTFYENLTGKKPTTLSEFIEREKEKFIKQT